MPQTTALTICSATLRAMKIGTMAKIVEYAPTMGHSPGPYKPVTSHMSAQQLQSFQEISGCTDVNEARHYLESCNGDLERAINLFFSQSTRRKVVSMPSTSAAAASRSRANAGNDVSMIELSDDDDEPPIRNAGDYVRAPIAPVQGPIVEQSFQQTYGSSYGPSNPIFEQCRDFRELAEQQDHVLRRRIAHNGQRAGRDMDVNDVEAEESASSSSSSATTAGGGYRRSTRNGAVANAPSSSNGIHHRSGAGERNGVAAKIVKDLKTLFRPPLELMCQKEWDQVVLHARQQKRWLLVNVQKAAEFACQMLNRDIWSEPTVREIIQENFIFWQTYHDSSCGVRVCSYYEIFYFPAIFIIDPRTGEEVKKMRAPDAVSFLDQVTSFLDSYPTFEARDAEICGQPIPVANGQQQQQVESVEQSFSDESVSTSNRRRKRKSHLNEINDGDGANDTASGAANLQAKRMRRIVNISDMDEMIVDEPSPVSSAVAKNNSVALVSPDEWQNHIGTANNYSKSLQLLLKLPNGGKEKLSLPDTTKLKALFLYIAGRNLSPHEHHFVLSFPKRVFNIDCQEQTLAAVSFASQEVVHVERI